MDLSTIRMTTAQADQYPRRTSRQLEHIEAGAPLAFVDAALTQVFVQRSEDSNALPDWDNRVDVEVITAYSNAVNRVQGIDGARVQPVAGGYSDAVRAARAVTGGSTPTSAAVAVLQLSRDSYGLLPTTVVADTFPAGNNIEYRRAHMSARDLEAGFGMSAAEASNIYDGIDAVGPEMYEHSTIEPSPDLPIVQALVTAAGTYDLRRGQTDEAVALDPALDPSSAS